MVENNDGGNSDAAIQSAQFANNPQGRELYNQIQKNHSHVMKKGKKGAKDGEDISNIGNADTQVFKLIGDMTDALEADIKSNK